MATNEDIDLQLDVILKRLQEVPKRVDAALAAFEAELSRGRAELNVAHRLAERIVADASENASKVTEKIAFIDTQLKDGMRKVASQ